MINPKLTGMATARFLVAEDIVCFLLSIPDLIAGATTNAQVIRIEIIPDNLIINSVTIL